MRMKLLLNLLAVAVILNCFGDVHGKYDYCKITTEHTACPKNTQASKCGNGTMARGVTKKDEELLLKTHNEMRNKVALGKEKRGDQPKATNMMKLTYDQELAKVAQALADKCRFEHDCNKCRKVDRFSVGQNLYISYERPLQNKSPNWPKAIQGWYDEVDLFGNDLKGVDSYKFNSGTGHYTQVVWAETTHIGCGFSVYEEDGWYKKLYVCNYGPAGNTLTRPIYKRGATSSACPNGTIKSKKYKGLCDNDFCSDTYDNCKQLAAEKRCKDQYIKSSCIKSCGICGHVKGQQ